ncbi:MAG: hypothetical protein RQ745_09545 [Longimicrobiales bacterium]|nr:hypothetical protein [Longimicrobiales bacterium]
MTLGEWVARRTPPVPAGFRACVKLDDPQRDAATPEARVEGLLGEARAALARARAHHASDRDGAFDLLAADAFATWAAEAALEADDPIGALAALASRLSDPAR